jgi:hypothetical protein
MQLGVPPLIRLVGKSPIDEAWTIGPRAEPEVWRSRLHGWGGNLGLLAGALRHGGFLVVVDADARVPGYEDSLQTLYELGLPRETVTVLTGGGGLHLYFFSHVPIAKGPLAEFPGIDIQGEGSQVVVPYSIHENGRQYEYEFGYGPEDVALAVLPDALVELFGKARERAARKSGTPTADDEHALRILTERYGGHDPIWKGDHYVITRKGKPGSTGSATIGVIAPGGVHVFTSGWAELPPGNYSLFQLAARSGEIAEEGAAMLASIPSARVGLDVTKLADVDPERVSWLWPWRVPLGKLSILEGDPGHGKSTLSLAVASIVTRGEWFPDGHGTGHASNVVLLTGEDGLADTVRPRVEAQGGDAARVFAIRGHYTETDSERYLDLVALPRDLQEVEAVVRRTDARLVIVDPLAVFTRMKGDAYRDSDMRAEVLGPLAALAERTGCAVLCVRHLTKSHGSNVLYAGGGSIALTAAARLVMLLGPHPTDPQLRVLAVAKCNLAPIAPSLAFALVPVEGSSSARVDWRGEVPYTAADVLGAHGGGASGDEDGTTLKHVSEWLAETIAAAGGEMPSAWLDQGAKVMGFSHASVRRARKVLGVRADHRKGSDGRFAWWVILPPEEETEPGPRGSLPDVSPLDPLRSDLPRRQGAQEVQVDPLVPPDSRGKWDIGDPANAWRTRGRD